MGEQALIPNISFTFRKEERLCSNVLIEKLFQSKTVFKHYPFLFSFMPVDMAMPYPAQVLITVSKKRFPRAVHRNEIKRLGREIYRLRKHELYEILRKHNITAAVGLTYIAAQKLPFTELEKAFSKIISSLSHELAKTSV